MPRSMRIYPVISVSNLTSHKEGNRFEQQPVRPPLLDKNVFRAECISAKKNEGRIFRYFVNMLAIRKRKVLGNQKAPFLQI